ncbi:MAG: hypothetical protein EBR34_15280 [Sphingomonadaceae bacterium]|nr:hypothetical protein [Sphingomonadaceae bacterium]
MTKRKGGPKRTNAPLWVTRDDGIVIEAAQAGRTFADLCAALPHRSPRQVQLRILTLGAWEQIDKAQRDALLVGSSREPQKLHKTMPSAARGPLLVVAHTADPLRVARHYLRTVWRFDAVALCSALAAQCPRPQGWTPAEAQAQAEAAAKSLGPAHEKALRLALLNVH